MQFIFLCFRIQPLGSNCVKYGSNAIATASGSSSLITEVLYSQPWWSLLNPPPPPHGAYTWCGARGKNPMYNVIYFMPLFQTCFYFLIPKPFLSKTSGQGLLFALIQLFAAWVFWENPEWCTQVSSWIISLSLEDVSTSGNRWFFLAEN